MKFKPLRTFAILAVCLFALAMVGCGPDEEEPSEFLRADPADGSTIDGNDSIFVAFDISDKPYAFEISEVLEVPGATVEQLPYNGNVNIGGANGKPFALGPLALELQWEGETVTLNYTVVDRQAEAMAEAMAELAGSYSLVELDPAGIRPHEFTGDLTLNSDGTFQAYIEHAISGVSALETEGTWSADGTHLTLDELGPTTTGITLVDKDLPRIFLPVTLYIEGDYTWDGTHLIVSSSGGEIRWERN